MGKTSFSGPVYGAKSLLMSGSFLTGSTGASSHTDLRYVVPVGEDWYVTEFGISASTNSSGTSIVWQLKTEGGSSNIPRYQGQPSTVAQTLASVQPLTSTSINSLTIITPTAGEYEGAYVPTGSTVRVVSSGAAAPSLLCYAVHGYRRFVNSTRSEG